MKTLLHLVVAFATSVFVSSLHAQTSPLFMVSGDDQDVFEFQHSGVINSFTATQPHEYPVAIALGIIRTIGSDAGRTGHEYLLNGTPTGSVLTNPGMGINFDGTTDGVSNYAVDFSTGDVYRTNLYWSSPTLLFNTGRQNDIGITYDFRNNTLWIANYNSGNVFNYTLTGTALGTFSTGLGSTGGLARDAADGTFWITSQSAAGTLYQFDSGGNLLNTVAAPSANGQNFLSGEFETKCVAAPAGMVGWWPGDGWFNDIAGTSEGQSQNGVGFTTGKVGQAFTFDGSSQYVLVGDPPALQITGTAVSIDGWVYPTATQNATYFGKASSGNNDFALFYLGEVEAYIKTNGIEHTIGTNGYTPPLNTWTHLAMTYDGSTATIYANGQVIGSASVSGNISDDGTAFAIGGRTDNDLFFAGSIDEVEVFTRGLTVDEVNGIYNAGRFGKCREGLLKITCLTEDNAVAEEVDTTTGDDEGGMAISSSKVFLEGDDQLGIFNRSDLSTPMSAPRIFGIFSDIRSQKVYSLADANGDPAPSLLCPNTFEVAKIVELDQDTGAPTANVITLSSPISITADCLANFTEAGVFSGVDRVVLVDGDTHTAYNIDLPSGFVTNLGAVTASHFINRQISESWATWGVAEYFGGKVYLVYRGDDGQTIYRTDVATNDTSVVATIPDGLSDMATFSIAPSLRRWYFHYEGNAFAGNRDETLGYADACFATANVCDSNPPVITVPNDIFVNAKNKHGKRVKFQVSAVDPEDGPVPATANPPSGSLFKPGHTTVVVTATDSCGNTATKTFTVTVERSTRR